MFIKLSIEQEIVTLLKLLNYPICIQLLDHILVLLEAIIGNIFRNIILVSRIEFIITDFK